jgi:hypothetical protein
MIHYNYNTVNQSELNQSIKILDAFTTQNESEMQTDSKLNSEVFSKNKYGHQSTLQTALNILNKAVVEGTPVQKLQLLNNQYSKIKALNTLLQDHEQFKAKAARVGFNNAEIETVKGYQIALPQTNFERFIEVITLIPRIAISILGEFTALIGAAIAIPIDSIFDLNPSLSLPKNTQIITPNASERNDKQDYDARPFSGTIVKGVVCLNSPLRGTPSLDLLCNPQTMNERYKQMTISNQWRDKLFADSHAADRDGKLAVYTYGSTLDAACPDNCHVLSDNPTRNMTVATEGHLATMLSPRAIAFMRNAIDKIDPTGKLPVAMLHGSSAGKYQFTALRMFTGRQTFAVDYAEGRFSNDPNTRIDQYSHNDKIKDLFRQIHQVTGTSEVIIVGHSMGGLIGLDIARTTHNSELAAV